jgi:16S rRNA (uracil1498-N3)-methyltransferase
MHRTRLFIRDELAPNTELQMGIDQTRYLGRALRLKAGDQLTVFNGTGGEFIATIVSIGKTSSVLAITEQLDARTESPLKIHLVQGVSRGERMDFVVQKATELGVKRVTPILTDHGVVKLDAARAVKRRDHWQSIAESACEQSGRTRPPLIDTPIPLKNWFGGKTSDADIDLILSPDAQVSLASIAAPATKVCFLIGPEGGFSAGEYEDAEIAGCTAVTFGPRILRTETAAVAAIAVVQSLWGDMGI